MEAAHTGSKTRTKITNYQKNKKKTKPCASCVAVVSLLTYFPSNKIFHNFETFMVKFCSSDIVWDFSQSALLSCAASPPIGWKFSAPSNQCAPLRAGFKLATNQQRGRDGPGGELRYFWRSLFILNRCEQTTTIFSRGLKATFPSASTRTRQIKEADQTLVPVQNCTFLPLSSHLTPPEGLGLPPDTAAWL